MNYDCDTSASLSPFLSPLSFPSSRAPAMMVGIYRASRVSQRRSSRRNTPNAACRSTQCRQLRVHRVKPWRHERLFELVDWYWNSYF